MADGVRQCKRPGWDSYLHMATGNALWQHPAMIEYCTLSDSRPDSAHATSLYAALLTLNYARNNGVVGSTKPKANACAFNADHAHPPLSLTSAPIPLAYLAVNR